jgi:tetratricopeptide (TPR) repeat protein
MAHYNLGYLYQDKGNTVKSIDSFRQAAIVNPDDVDTQINYGLALKHNGELDAAIQAYLTAIRLDEKCAMAQFNLGNLYQDMKDYDNAIRCFERVLLVDAAHGDAMFNLAVAYQDRAMNATSASKRVGDLQNALMYYEMVQKCSPELIDAAKAAEYLRGVLTNPLEHQ